MPTAGRDLAKGTVVTLIPTGLGFVLSGPLVGTVCLFVALVISLVLWTPLGPWLGIYGERPDPRLPLIRGELALAREEAAHAKTLLAHTDPVTAAMVKAVWPDWRDKMATYLNLAISLGAGAKFAHVGREKTVMAIGEPVSVNLDIGLDIEMLDGLLADLRSEAIEADQEALEAAAQDRRANEAASLFSYSDAAQ